MQNGYVREQGGASSVASASEHNSDQLQAVGESLFVPSPDFLAEQKQDGANLTIQSKNIQSDSPVNIGAPKGGVGAQSETVRSDSLIAMGAPRSEVETQPDNSWPTSLTGRHAETAPASANTLSAPVGTELPPQGVELTSANAVSTPANIESVLNTTREQTPGMERKGTAFGQAPDAEKNGAVASQILSLENGSATPKELEKLSNVAERKVAQARIESGDNPARFALLIARARREQIESAKGVKS